MDKHLTLSETKKKKKERKRKFNFWICRETQASFLTP